MLPAPALNLKEFAPPLLDTSLGVAFKAEDRRAFKRLAAPDERSR